MSDGTHEERVLRVIKGFNEKLGVRILPDLDRGMESYAAIYDLLAGLQARPLLRKIDAGSSNMKITYGLPDGREVHFKQILANRIKECETCPLNNPNDCKEGYYGVRLYVDKQGVYKVGVCLQRMDLVLPVVEFVKSNLCSDILNHRAAEFKRLQSLHAA
jgi:cyclic pyranopterin phosphate synthase